MPIDDSKTADWPVGSGEMVDRIRAFDWPSTPLGPAASWPHGLKKAVQICLDSAFAGFVWWGDDFVQLYNDAALSILKSKHPSALGASARKTWEELWPDIASLVEQVMTTGEAVRREDLSLMLDRGGPLEPAYFTFSYSALRDEAGAIAGMNIIAIETTARVTAERRRMEAEAALRESAERQTFLLKLSDTLRPLDNPTEIQTAALRVLGETLQVDRAVYTEITADGTHNVGVANFTRGNFPQTTRPYPLKAFSVVADRLRAGKTSVIPDVYAEEDLSDEAKSFIAGQGVLATAAVPLMKGGRWISTLSIHQGSPRAWTETEIMLVRETGERTWDAVERARAENAQRESEERFRQFADASSDVLWIRNAETLEMEFVSRACETVCGIPCEEFLADGRIGATLVVPDDRDMVLERLEIVRGGAPALQEFRIIRATDGAIRWIRSNEFPILDDEGRVQRIAGIAMDITEAKQAVELQAILLAELQHRVRNIMAMIRSVTARTADTAASVQDYAELMSGRLMALARAQTLLTRAVNTGADLGTLVRDELAAHAHHEEQYELSGPELTISPKAAEVLSLAIHELAVNALKYGALSGSEGKVSVAWQVIQPDREPRLHLTWSETSPTLNLAPPTRRGFGSNLIEQRVAYELGGRGEINITPGGAQALIEFPLRHGTSILETNAPARASVYGGSIDMSAESNLAGQRVLVIEDDFYLAADTANVLRRAGAEVIGPFPHEAAATEAIARERLGAAIVDINLGSGPSFEAANALTKAGVPFLFLTGYDERSIPPEFEHVRRLQKPTELRQIVRAVAALLEPH